MTPQSILIIKTSSLGDIVCALPVLAELRRLYPEAHIAWVVDHRFADLLDGHPYLQGIYRFVHYKPRVGQEALTKARAFLREIDGVVDRIRRSPWDVALDVQSNFKSSLILARCGARMRIAQFSDLRHVQSLYSANRLVLPRRSRSIHRPLAIARPLGVTGDDPQFCLWIPNAARAWAAEQLANLARGPRLILNPGASDPVRCWPARFFATAARSLLDAGRVASVVVTGSAADRRTAEAILEDAGSAADRILDLTGRTTLHQLAAVLDAGTTMVSGDTGPMHMMAALGKPVVALFGPSDPANTGPYGEGHVLLLGPRRRLDTIAPERVVAAVTGVLDRRSGGEQR